MVIKKFYHRDYFMNSKTARNNAMNDYKMWGKNTHLMNFNYACVMWRLTRIINDNCCAINIQMCSWCLSLLAKFDCFYQEDSKF